MEYRCDISDATFYEEDGILVGVTQAGHYEWERDDCGVIALSLVADISYRLAHAILKLLGRKDRGYTAWLRLVRRGPIKWRRYVVKPITVRKFIQNHPKGRYAVVLRPAARTCHVASIIDGVFLNCNTDSVKARIYFAWKFEGLKKGI